MDKYLSGILAQFGVKEEDIKEIAPYGDGHINSTYRYAIALALYDQSHLACSVYVELLLVE